MLVQPEMITFEDWAESQSADASMEATFYYDQRTFFYLPRFAARGCRQIGLALAVAFFILVAWCSSASRCIADSALPKDTRHSSMPSISLHPGTGGAFHVSFKGPFAGRELLLFREASLKSPPPIGAHLVGIRRMRGQSSRTQAATLSLFENNAFLFISTRRAERRIVVRLDPNILAGSRSLSRSQLSWVRSGQHLPCGAIAAHTKRHSNVAVSPARVANSLTTSGEPRSTPRVSREVEMGIFYDPLLAAATTGSVVEYLSATIFAANELYLQQAGVRVRARRLEALGIDQVSPSLVYPERLLDSFRALILPISNSADLFHLFTASKLDEATAGVAYVGTACVDRGRYAVGLSRILPPALQPIVFAHEVLHGLGAEHDAVPKSLMDPILGTGNTKISRPAKATISRYLKGPGFCIKPTTPLEASLTIQLTTTEFSAAVSIKRPPPPSCTIVLQGRIVPLDSQERAPKGTGVWKALHRSNLSALPLNQVSLRYSAPAPEPTIDSENVIQMRALVRCGRIVKATGIKNISPSRDSPITTDTTRIADWIEQLSASIQTSPG
jgi:hypothetical protein